MDAPTVALSFDDGPGPSTGRLLDVLARYAVPATFFLLGRNLQGEALGGDGERALELATRAAREGHLLGNHTMTHARELPPEELLAEVVSCDAIARGCYLRAGRTDEPAIPVRLPYGPFRPDGQRSVDALEAAGRPHCHWTGDPQDWRPERTAAEIVELVIAHADKAWQHQRTPVVLLHDAGLTSEEGGVLREATVEAVEQLCGRMRARGARFLTLWQCDPRRYRLPGGRRDRPPGPAAASGT